MKNKLLNLTFSGLLFMSLFAVVFVTGCSEDDDMPTPGDDPVASFQYEISMANFLEVSFQNFSQNATSYEWDFGDGNTSTEEEPTHTYDGPGTYTVTLTATNADGQSADRSEDINITDPNEQLTLLAGADSKTWYLQREGVAMGIGPAVNDNQWWSFGGVTPLADRPCILDDAYTFHRDGTFEFESNNTLFVDSEANGGWLGPDEPEGCHDEDEAGIFTTPDGTDISAFANGGNYTFEFQPDNNTLTLLGEGAYIGLANKTNGGDNFIPVTVKEYTIFNFVDGDVADSLGIALEGDGFSWNFYLVSYDNPADLPDIPTVAPPFGEDLTDISPVELENTFESASSFILLDTIVPSGSTLVYGVDDPADANATKVGQFNRTDAQFQELQFQTKPKHDINFENLTTVSLDVYLPSANNYSGSLTKGVIIGIGDKSATAQWWTDHYEFVNDGSTLPLDEWVTLTYQLDSHNAGAGEGTIYDRNDLDMIYINIGGSDHNDTGTFFVRNLKFE